MMKPFLTVCMLAIASNGYCDHLNKDLARKLVNVHAGVMVYSDYIICASTNPEADDISFSIRGEAPAGGSISRDVFVSRVAGITVRFLITHFKNPTTDCVTTARPEKEADISLDIKLSTKGYSLTMTEPDKTPYRHSGLWRDHRASP